MMNKIVTSTMRRGLGSRLMSSHHKTPKEIIPKASRHRTEDVLTDSSKFLSSTSKFKSTMPFETLVQVITEQELAAAKKVVRK